MEESNLSQPYAVSKKLLLGIHAIIPTLLGLMLMDVLFLNSELKEALGLNATNAAVYVLFLELPHIIGSFIGYADSEYLSFYKKKLFVFLPLLLLTVFMIITVNVALALLIYLTYTMYHSIRQQTGIAKMLVSSHTKVHSLWSVVAVISAIVGNLFIFAPLFFAQYAFLVSLPILTVCALCFVVVSAWYLSVLPSSGIGWWYIFATTTMLCTSYVFAVAGYVFFAILLVRFVHDATAFVFYSIHDSNRNAYTRKNFVYRLLKPTHLPLLCVTPVVGIGVAYVLQKYGVSFEQSASAVILIAVAHYYLESFMWKRDALHRKQLRFVA